MARSSTRKAVVGALVGATVAALAIGLFTSVGTSTASGPPQAGGMAPRFSLSGLNVAGRVGTPESGGGNGKPVVVLFMGDWCTICHSEVPRLAAKITALRSEDNALRRLPVIGVDSEDTASNALSFIKSSGVTFPVGDDGTAHVMNAVYRFEGDPYAVFIEGSGRIMAIHPGPLSPSEFVTLARRLLAS
ncbi:MAG TPA: TlpA disulfide reductase family protein [Acidimicrobiales bacterium]|jgi:thiol-disulfide isomerase/thioredoxin